MHTVLHLNACDFAGQLQSFPQFGLPCLSQPFCINVPMLDSWQHVVQLLTKLSKSPKDNRMAIGAIQKSALWADLKAKVLAQADRANKTMSREKQVSLFKMGRFTEDAWVLLAEELKEHVKLWSPSTLRTVKTNLH